MLWVSAALSGAATAAETEPGDRDGDGRQETADGYGDDADILKHKLFLVLVQSHQDIGTAPLGGRAEELGGVDGGRENGRPLDQVEEHVGDGVHMLHSPAHRQTKTRSITLF